MVKIWPFLAKIAIFEGFWPLTSKHRYECSYFLVSRGAAGTYGLAFVRPSVCPSICPSVRSVEISKTAHRIVLIFGTKL